MGKQLNLDSRRMIADGLKHHLTFSEIAENIGVNKSTIGREIKNHRVFFDHKDVVTIQTKNVCAHRWDCKIRDKCNSPTCFYQYQKNCKFCGNCNSYCEDFEEEICHKCDSIPYVCNGCPKKNRCPLSKWEYDPVSAQKAVDECRSASRSGPCLSKEQMDDLNDLISPLIKNGQSIKNICFENKDNVPVCEKTIYRYIDQRFIDARKVDLRRTVQRKTRNKSGPPLKVDKKCRIGRTYEDFQTFLKNHPDVNVVEIDTVEGTRGGPVILTLYFRNCGLQLAFLRESNTAATVKEVFDYLKETLTYEEYISLFYLILTDRGTEFSNPLEIEMNPENGELVSNIFYCDARHSEQKGQCERNHEFIRYVLPKGRSFQRLTQEDVTRMMNHINSYPRSKFNGKSPIELFNAIYGEPIAKKLNISLIPGNEIRLVPELIK